MAQKPATDRFFSVTSYVYNSPAFHTLPSAALKLWVDLRTEYRGANNGNISAALSLLRHRGWCSSETLSRALWELLQRGLLRRTREGKPGPLRLCALFAFTDLPISSNDKLGLKGAGPSMEFASWVPGESFAPGSKAKKLARNTSKKKPPVRNSEQQRFDNRNVTATRNGELEQCTATKTETVNARSDDRETAPVLASEQIVH
jgi:hypothetical protein